MEDTKKKLMATFTMEKVERAVMEMKAITAPGPDGFPISFYKGF